MIALITDFGSGDYFKGVIKGVMKGINPGIDIIDITHNVYPFSITNAQFILHASYRHFPKGTIFYVVVDPEVGTSRRGIIALSGSYYFIMPDNGIISAVKHENFEVYEIDCTFFDCACSTFHGRDVFAPIAARLSKGDPIDIFGKKCTDYVERPFPRFTQNEHMIEGEIIHIDRFGNIITSIPNTVINRDNYTVTIKGNELKAQTCGTYAHLPQHQVGLLKGSSDFVELALNQRRLSDICGANLLDTLKLHYGK